MASPDERPSSAGSGAPLPEPTSPPPGPPVGPGLEGGRSLDRAGLERVLARAAELQARETELGEPTLSDEQLVEVGREVGLAPHHIRQALAEERTRVPEAEEAGTMAALFGPARTMAQRTVPGSQEAVFAALDLWMQREECLQVKRLFPDRMLWERRTGLFSSIKRELNMGGRGYHLARAHEIAATVVPVDGERVLVRLEADLSNVRSQRVASGALVGTGGLAVTGALLALGFMPALAAVPALAGLGGGYAVSRGHRPLVSRVQLALEQVLDRLERGDAPRTSLLSTLGAMKLIR